MVGLSNFTEFANSHLVLDQRTISQFFPPSPIF